MLAIGNPKETSKIYFYWFLNDNGADGIDIMDKGYRF